MIAALTCIVHTILRRSGAGLVALVDVVVALALVRTLRRAGDHKMVWPRHDMMKSQTSAFALESAVASRPTTFNASRPGA